MAELSDDEDSLPATSIRSKRSSLDRPQILVQPLDRHPDRRHSNNFAEAPRPEQSVFRNILQVEQYSFCMHILDANESYVFSR